MSYTVTVSGKSTELTANFNPAIHLDNKYEIGLLNFESFNSIPNFDESNNRLYYGIANNYITIPTGSYELEDLNAAIKKELGSTNFELYANNNTLKCYIQCDEQINFSLNNTFGDLLGFGKEILAPKKLHESKKSVEIIKVNVINIDCNIASGSYNNGELSHTIHQFFPAVPPGFKIVETPQNIIYFPVIINNIDSITFKILDQSLNKINFRDETITIRTHLRRCV